MNTKAIFIDSSLAQYTAEEFSWLQKFFLNAGVLGDSSGNLGLAVSQKSSGANMSVDVAVGNGILDFTKNSTNWKVIGLSQSIVNVTIPANSSGSNRVDAIIMRASTTAEPNSLKNNIITIERVAGTGITALTDNAISTAISGDAFIRLADVTVSNGASSIVNANISDTRIQVKTNEAIKLAPKTINFSVLSSDPTTPVEGQLWYNSTTHTLNFYNNSSIKQLGSTQGQFNPLLPSAQSTPNMTIAVAQGNVRFGNVNINFAGGNSPSFTAPLTASNKRIDLLCIDNTGTLSIVTGTDTTGTPIAPTYPSDLFVICEVFLRNGMTSIKSLDDSTNGYISNDARGFSVANGLHKTFVSGESITGSTTPLPVGIDFYQADGGIQYDNANVGSSSFTSGTHTYNVTVGNNSNRKLILIIDLGFTNIGFGGMGTPTVNGVNMTQFYTGGGGGSSQAVDGKIAMYYLDAPNIGTNTLSISFSNYGGSTYNVSTVLYSIYNAATGAPSGYAQTSSGGTTSISPSASVNNSMFIVGRYTTGTGNYTGVTLSNLQTSTLEFGTAIVMNTGATTISKSISGSTVLAAVISPYTTPITSVKKASSSNTGNYARFIGFAISTQTTAGQNISVQTDGIISGFSGLSIGSVYYLNDTAGTISNTVGTNTKKVGIATSATQLLLLNS